MKSHSLIKVARSKVLDRCEEILPYIEERRQEEWEEAVSRKMEEKTFWWKTHKNRESAIKALKSNGFYNRELLSTHYILFSKTNQEKKLEKLKDIYSRDTEEFVYITIEDANSLDL